MKDHISSVLTLSKEEQEKALTTLLGQIFDDLQWIKGGKYGEVYCKSLKQLFLDVELDNLFYREKSVYSSYENEHWTGTKKVTCKNIPVYSFRYLSAFNKFFESKFEEAITTGSVKAQIISQIFAYLKANKTNDDVIKAV